MDYSIKDYTNIKLSDIEKKKIILECLKMALRVNFPVDYGDMKNHLFGEEDYVKLFVKNEKNEIKGFIIGCINYLDDIKEVYIHGLIIDPDMQGKSLSKKLMKELINVTDCDVITARTHNPRIFEAVSALACDDTLYFPNIDIKTPDYVYDIIYNNKFINNCNDNLICENAYPDIKIQQSVSNDKILPIFESIGDYDAQVILSVINKTKILNQTRTMVR